MNLRELLNRASQRRGISDGTKTVKAATCGGREKVADIQCVYTGKVFYEIDNDLVALLVEGLPSYFVRAQKKSEARPIAAAPVPQWAVAKNKLSEGYFIQAKIGSRVEMFAGSPDRAAETFASIGLQVPASVVAEYAAMLKLPLPCVPHGARRDSF